MSSVIFSQADWEYVKSLWSESNSKNGEGYGNTAYNGNILKIKRDVQGHYIDFTDTSLLSFVLKRTSQINIPSITLGEVKLTKYTRGDYFSPHKDYTVYDAGVVRKTLVIQLSSPHEYDGGTLIVEGIPQSRELGSAILFNSNQIHEVTEITQGTRFSLVAFLLDKDILMPKSVI